MGGSKTWRTDGRTHKHGWVKRWRTDWRTNRLKMGTYIIHRTIHLTAFFYMPTSFLWHSFIKAWFIASKWPIENLFGGNCPSHSCLQSFGLQIWNPSKFKVQYFHMFWYFFTLTRGIRWVHFWLPLLHGGLWGLNSYMMRCEITQSVQSQIW